MVFLTCLAFVSWANLITYLKAFLRSVGGGSHPSGAPLLHMLAITCMVLGFLPLLFGAEPAYPPDQSNWFVWGIFFCGVFTSLAFGLLVVRTARNQKSAHAQGLAFGMSVWAAFAGLYMAGTALDHWWFFRDSNAGVISDKVFKIFGVEAEAQCNDPLLVRIRENDAIYRCPKITVFGSTINKPFVPWPDYREGTSVKLKEEIEKRRLWPPDTRRAQP